MLKDLKKFLSGEGLPKHPKKHHKPFRIHHVTLFFAGIILFIVSAFGIGFVFGRSASTDTFITPPQHTSQGSVSKEVKSSLGFQFKYDPAVFYAEGQAANKTSKVTGDSLSAAEALVKVVLQPKPAATAGGEVLSELSIETDENNEAFESFKADRAFSDINQALEAYYLPDDSEYFSYEKQTATKEKIGGKEFTKITYKQVPRFGTDSKPVYQTVWIGLNQDRPIKIQLQGLLSTDEIPGLYNQVFSSLRLGVVSGSSLEPLSFNIFSNQEDVSKEEIFDINTVSPAVVKVYHFICGSLVLQDRIYGKDLCAVNVGSGFLVSSDGLIATNGHVVAKDAADILVGEFLENPALLAQYAASEGLSLDQTTRSDVVASLLAKIYDLPESELRLENKDEIILAAIGEKPVSFKSEESIRRLQIDVDDDFVKEAKLLEIDYEPKDLLVIEQGNELGFSASDVALLKIDVQQAPFIELADSSALQQNAGISLIGFPSDAENNLISSTDISPTVTNGTISSIRTARGSDSKLFQTDADASQGNSGGPAIDQNNQVFGILTYRFKDGNITNAAKSYIRDIADLKELIASNDLTLNTDSQTQAHWEEGLRLFNQSRYSAALEEFKIVYSNYPAHRLVNTYGSLAQKAIKEGKDIKDTNYSLVGLIYGAIAGLVGIIIGGALIAHHHKSHQAYKKEHAEN